jgi:hypothetical protein
VPSRYIGKRRVSSRDAEPTLTRHWRRHVTLLGAFIRRSFLAFSADRPAHSFG